MKNKDTYPSNKKGQAHGLWVSYNPDGKIWSKCNWVNGIKCGYEEHHHHIYNIGRIKKKYHIR